MRAFEKEHDEMEIEIYKEVQDNREVSAKMETNIVKQTKLLIQKEQHAKYLQAKLHPEVQKTKANVRSEIGAKEGEI